MSLRCLSLVKSFRGNLCCAFKQQKYHHIARLNRNPYRYFTAMAGTGINKTFDDIIKSEEDKRLYRGLELQNGLKILLISDPTTDKSSAAMDVNIGHMSDPKDIPGLAHFCEHMLFLGTEKYPVENEYSKYLSEHGGSSNAFTSAEHTNFYFDVAPENLDGALLRFAQFFLTPLFTPSATEREVNAVNSENDKNLMNDHWRLHQLEKATSNPDHDFHKFGTGNKDTLLELPKARGVDVRDELLKFHKKFYSSNIMALAVLGKESLEELTEMVVPLFDKVENKSVKVPEWPDHPFNAECLKIKAHIVPVKDLRNMNVTFPIPDLQDQYKCNPGHYLGHLIGHEGPGSLLSELKSRGWVNNLVGGQKEGAKGFMFFILNVDLSEEGIEHTDDIITLMFQYLNMLKKEGPQQWVFDECRDLNRMGFRFKDKEKPRNYTCNCSSLLHDYPMKEVLCGGYLMEEYKPEWIKDVLAHLLPEKIRIAVVGKKFDGHTNETEKWYGTNYAVAPIDEDLLKKWADAGFHEKLALPDKNEFIPTDFSIVEREEHLETAPKVVRDSSMIRMWFKQDDKFLLPKACINIEVTSPLAYMDPLSTNMSYMFVALLRDALNEYAYAAELAGISYDIHSTIYGLTLTVKGYHDKQHILLKKILEKMTTFEINTQRFDILKENYVRGLKNFQAEQPHQHAIYYTSVLMCEQLWTKDELLEACEELTVERLQGFMPQLLARLYIEMLVYGNVTKKRGNEIADIVQDILKTGSKTKPLLPSQQRRFREYQLPDGCSYVYKKNNDVHKSSSLEVYYQCNLQETHSNMVLELFCQIINEPCFDMLRTQEQLGYIVFSGVRRSNGVQGLRVIVQSDKVPEYVEKRIEAFLLKMKAAIEEMDDESFQKHVQALATRRMEKPKKLSGQNAKYWSEIITQWYNFDRDNVEVDRLKTLVKDDIVKFYNDNISYTAPKRHKVSVHVVSTAPDSAGNDTANGNGPSDGEPTVTDPVEICDVSLFKRGLGLFPLPKPFINVGSPNSKL